MAYHEIEKESFLHKDGEERVFFVDKDARERLDDAESRLDDLEQGGGGGGSGAVTSVNGKTGAVVLDASDVGALPDNTVIPPAVTEQTISGWGFTKNTGTYSKPSGGIPASDLASAVQTSLGKADTALQQHQSLSGYATEQWVQNQGYLTQHQSLAAYQTKSITDTGGYYTTDTVEGALQEIGGKLLPSGGSTGDFLRKTASGVAWQTVPSAESNSFGGGS